MAGTWANDIAFIGLQPEIDRVKLEINKCFNYTEQKGFVKCLGVGLYEK
jgi:hypothetical protein